MAETRTEFIARRIRRRFGASTGNIAIVTAGPTVYFDDAPVSITCVVGDAGVVTAVPRDRDGNITGVPFWWVSSNVSVLTVDADTGAWTAVGTGSAVLYPQLTNPAVSSGDTTNITDAPSSISGAIGDTGVVTVLARNQAGNPTGAAVYWESLNPSVCTVNTTTGAYTFVGNGTAVLRPRLTPLFTPLVPPVFDRERFVTVKRMDADSYTTIADVFADGFDNGLSADVPPGAYVADTHILGLPSQMLISETHDDRAGGKAVRLRYFGVSDEEYPLGYNEAHSLGYNLPGGAYQGNLAGTPAHPLVIDYYRRIMYRGSTGDGSIGQIGSPTEGTPPTIGGTPHIDTNDPTGTPPIPNGQNVQLKANEIWICDRAKIIGVQAGRSQVCLAPTPAGRHSNNVPYPAIAGSNGTINEFVSERGHNPVEGVTGPDTLFFASQQSGPFQYQVDGQYHHVQIVYATNSTPVSDDGYCMLYINGVLVMAVHPDYVDVLNPDSVVAGESGADTRWCTISDIRRIYAAYAPDDGYGGHDTGGPVGVKRFSVGVVANNGPAAAYDVDIDRYHLYRKR